MPWRPDVEPTVREVARRVWSCEQPDGPRIIRQVVIAGETGTLVVDTGLPDSPAAGILGLLDRLAGEVTILLTHPDADHVGGTAAILDRHPRARLLAGAADVPLIGDPGRTIRERYARFAADGITFAEADADRALARFGPAFGPAAPAADGALIDLGGLVVELLATPGHSAGHTAAWVPGLGVLAAGDAVMGAGITDVVGDLYIPPMYAPPGTYRATIERLAGLDAAMLLSGHEPVLTDRSVTAFLVASREACDRLGRLVGEALDERPATLPVLCARVHASYGGLPDGRQRDLALTVDGHLEDLVAAGDAVVDGRAPRTFRRSA